MSDHHKPVTRRLGLPSVSRFGRLAYAIALAVLALDQLSKFWVMTVLDLSHRAALQILPFFRLTFVDNPGVSFNLLRADTDVGRWLLVAFALAVVAVLAVWAHRAANLLTAVALGLMMGGAVGNNLVDRIRFGAVTDFLDFNPVFPWVFNVADSALNIGVGLLLLELFLSRKEVLAVTHD